MAIQDSERPSGVTEGAVFETVRRVNAEALSLLTRRSEINRRIRHIHRLMHGLRNLAGNTLLSGNSGSLTVQETRVIHPCTKQLANQPACRASTTRRGELSQSRRLSTDGPNHLFGRLRRACRIALMEAGGAASLDEIRSRIVRRGSFSFPDSAPSDSVITQTLDSMAVSAEVRRLQSGARLVWQRIMPAEEIDASH